MEPTESVLRVALAKPISACFDYLPPAGTDPAVLKPGVRLRVPFGRGEEVAVLLGVVGSSEIPPERLRRASAVLDRAPLLDADLLRLARRSADYYHHPIGEVALALLPPALRNGEPLPGNIQLRWFATEAGQAIDAADLNRAPVQSRLLAQLQQHAQGASAETLRASAKSWRTAVQALQRKKWVELRELEIDACRHGEALDAAPALNPDQSRAVEAVKPEQGFVCHLLQGVTGSGKTEVYLRLIEAQLQADRQTLLLVPEIGLTPQLIERIQHRLATPFVVFHSGLSDSDRSRAWQQAATGKARLVLGTRSAIFTPLARPGLILVDEEHDPSFKQQDGFRYHARDLAILRASQLGIPIVLGSATPSLETLRKVDEEDYRLLQLPVRAGGAQAPKMRLIDLRGRPLHGAVADTLIAPIRRHLEQGSQVLVFLNRRGYAPVLICHECGWTADCHRCDAHMTLHHGSSRLRCHHCGAERPTDPSCGSCGSTPLVPVGKGTERIEHDLKALFAETAILRIDRDTTRRKGALQDLLAQIQTGAPTLLVGTQMIGKGHHFPKVTLVVVLDADRGLYGLDFRAAELMAQTIIQVAGRAGRAERPGEVLIATHAPDHPALRELVARGYGAFARSLLDERRQAGLPPYTYAALVRAESPDRDRPRDFLRTLRETIAEWGLDGVMALGPAAAPMERLAGRYRAQLLLQAGKRGSLHRCLNRLRPFLEQAKTARRVRWSIDVDPMDML